MTTTWTRKDGWVAITPVIDNGCRSLFAIGVTKAQDAPAILAPTELALNEAFGTPDAVPDGLEYRTDHGSVFTGGDCAALCETWRLDHTFSPVGRPTGNAVAERVIQTTAREPVIEAIQKRMPGLPIVMHGSSSVPPALLIRATSSFGTLELPCMTMGSPGNFFWIASMTSKWSDCCPLNL